VQVAVSGIAGFVGRHLASTLVERGHSVVGLGQGECPADLAETLERYVEADLTQGWPSLDGCDAVVHLAALSAVGPSFDQPQRYLEENCAMVTCLAKRQLRDGAVRTLVISSGGSALPPPADAAR
jgi:GDP-4-dehydro-6-deoxy-D-mannose reductase